MEDRNLRIDEVAKLVGLAESTVYAKLQKTHRSYDETFPKQFPIGGRAVAWRESEVRSWIAKQADKRKGAAKPLAPPEVHPLRPRAAVTSYAPAQLEVVRGFILENIRVGLVVAYDEAMRRARLGPEVESDRVVMEALLDRLSRDSFISHKALIGACVQHKRQGALRLGEPGPSTLQLARSLLGLERPDIAWLVQQVYEAYEDPAKRARGGRLLWVRNVELRTVRLIRDATASKKASRTS